MNHMQKKVLLITALASVFNIGASESSSAGNHAAVPYFSIRSQGTNAAREMIGWQDLINLCERDEFYGAFAVAVEYSQSFNGRDICECLFGGQTTRSVDLTTRSSNCNDCSSTCESTCASTCESSCDCDDCCIVVAGSCVGTRDRSNDWVAEYFGLPEDHLSTICFEPKIKSVVVDLEGYFGFGDCVEGLYARLNLPITWTKWELNAREVVSTVGTEDYQAGYFNADGVENANLGARALEFLNGRVPAGLDNVEALRCAKIAPCDSDCQDKVGLADVEGVFGWNFVCCDDYHFGLNLRATAPTGNKPDGKYLFEPIVGNGGHWEFGGGISTHANLWRCDENDASLNFYMDANITHLFKACQTRSFDLCCGANSRYWLALKLTDTTDGLYGYDGTGTGTASNFQFANEFAPIANLTCAKVEVSNSVQADIALKLAYANGEGFTFDLGYNFWARSCDKIEKCKPGRLETENWALKGTSYVYGFTGVSIDAASAVALAPSAGCRPEIVCGDSTNSNSIVNGQPAVLGEAASIDTVTDINGSAVNTSIQPRILGEVDVNYAGTKGLSNKVFANLNYSWLDCEDWTPFLGLGAAAEFGQGKDCNDCDSVCAESCDNSCSKSCSSDRDVTSSCVRCSLSQWSVWLKGGVAFN